MSLSFGEGTILALPVLSFGEVHPSPPIFCCHSMDGLTNLARFVGNERCWWWWVLREAGDFHNVTVIEIGVPKFQDVYNRNLKKAMILFWGFCRQYLTQVYQENSANCRWGYDLGLREATCQNIPERCYFARTRFKQFSHVSYQISIEMFTKGRLFEYPKTLATVKGPKGRLLKDHKAINSFVLQAGICT